MALLISLCQNAALLTIGVGAYSVARRTMASWRKLPQAVTTGAIFAGLTLLSMLAPLYVANAIMLDIRGTLIALAAAFAGPLAAGMAAIPAAIYRVEIGGPTTVPAMIALVTAAGFGWGLRSWAARNGAPLTIAQLAALGIAQALAVLTANLALDEPAVWQLFLSEFALPLALLTVIGVTGFGWLILDADRRHALHRLIGERDDLLRRNHDVVFRILRDEVATGRSLADQLRAITRITADALDVDWVSVWLYDDTQKQAACIERWDAMVGRHVGAPDTWFDELPDLRETLAKTLTYRVTDMRADPIADAYRRRHQPGSMPTSALYTAIRRGDRLIGHVAFATIERRRNWRIEDDTVIRSLADLVGIALLRDEVERKERRLRRNQELLVGIVRDELLRTAPLDEVLRSMTETIGEALEIDRTSVWLADPDGLHRCVDVWDRSCRQHLAIGNSSLVTQSPQIHDEFTKSLVAIIDDVATDPRVAPEHRDLMLAIPLKSLLIAAIGGTGEPIGSMTFASMTRERAWTLEDQTLARSLADLVGLAVLKDQLDRKEQALRRNQTLVMQIVRDELLRPAPLSEILASITAVIGRTLKIDRVSLWELAPADGAFHCRARWDGPNQRQMPSDPIPIPSTLSLFDGVKQDIVVSIVDFATDPRITPVLRERLGHDLPRSALIALIGTPDEPIGILVFASFENRHVWALEEQTLARSLAHLIAFALISHSYREAVAALDLVGEGIYVQGPTAEVIYANRAARDLGLLDGAAGSALADADIANELSWITSDGSHHALAVSRQRLPDGGIVTMLSDITDQKERQRRHELLEEQLRQTTKMEAVGRLAGGIAHDFNNMIGAILGFASFLAEDLPANGDQQGFAKRIIQVCERSRDVVKQLLAFSRPDDATKSVVDLRTAVIDNGALLKAALPPSTGFVMEVGADPLPVLANVGQIYQVLLNLCGNANDAFEGKPGNIIVSLALIGRDHPDRGVFEGGGHEPDLAVATGGWIDPDRPYASIRVVDNGGGMLQATIDQIFEPFFTTKDRGHGTGLGLAVVHGIVTAYQGAYAVRSRVGGGSDFSIYLPLAEPAPVERRARARTPQGQESVLVVDDEVDLTDMLSIGLGRLGYDVTCSNDPVEALSAFEQDPDAWNIVVTDQSMPTMTGTTMIKRLKTIRPDCIAILCTGFADGSAEDVALEAGADAFLLKPVEAHGVARTLRDLLDRRAVASVD